MSELLDFSVKRTLFAHGYHGSYIENFYNGWKFRLLIVEHALARTEPLGLLYSFINYHATFCVQVKTDAELEMLVPTQLESGHVTIPFPAQRCSQTELTGHQGPRK
jgi:hypothetical protein